MIGCEVLENKTDSDVALQLTPHIPCAPIPRSQLSTPPPKKKKTKNLIFL